MATRTCPDGFSLEPHWLCPCRIRYTSTAGRVDRKLWTDFPNGFCRHTSRRSSSRGRSTTLEHLLVRLCGHCCSSDCKRSAAPHSPGIELRIVQGNVPQKEKWAPENRETTLRRYLDLSTRPGPVDILLWPETAFPGFLDEDTEARARIAAAIPDDGVLLTGVPDRVSTNEGTSYFNTVQAYDQTGELLSGYAKHHLVPFGEYVPFRRWLPIERLTEGLGDFTPGPGPRTLALPGVPLVAVAICYEIIFPGQVVDDLFRPDWIFNATNDAWFGTSIGPEQHLASARMRAVEEGLPVVRAANTGISAIIDANGGLVARLGTGETGVINAPLPSARPPPLYARFGDWTLLALILACWIARMTVGRQLGNAWLQTKFRS